MRALLCLADRASFRAVTTDVLVVDCNRRRSPCIRTGCRWVKTTPCLYVYYVASGACCLS